MVPLSFCFIVASVAMGGAMVAPLNYRRLVR